MNQEEITKVNALTDANIFALAQAKFSAMPNFVSELPNFGESLSIVLGNKAKGFLEFLEVADMSHPELGTFFSKIDSTSLVQVLELCSLATKQNLQDVVPLLGKAIHKNTHDIFKGVDSRTQFVRALQPKWRDAARGEKEVRALALRPNFLGGKASGFNIYVRFSNTYKDEEAIAKRKAERYRQLGCNILQLEISKTLQGFEEIFKDEIYGFHRISLTNALIILMRVHDLRKLEDSSPCGPAWAYDKKTVKAKSDVLCQPRVYPLSALVNMMPQRVSKIVQHLEAFPELGGRPVFDHFLVVVPGIDSGGERSVDMAREKELISDGKIIPVLLGERDGKCYFISYWA